MKHYYYFVRDLAKATKETFVYHVSVGSSNKEFAKFCLVREYCKDCGFYFKPVSDISDTSIRNLEKRLFPGSRLFTSPLRRVSVSIGTLYDLIVDDSFVFFESNFAEKKGSFLFRSLIDPDFLARQSQKKNRSTLPAPPRKYLKSGNEADLNSFLIGSSLNVILFLLAAWLEGRLGL